MLIEGLVSTVIPVFNRPDLLREAVASVLAQDYKPIQIIIVDDDSTDATGRVADELAARHPESIRALHISNGGPGAAREAGRLVAEGEFIQYLDSDDLLLPGKFRLQVAGLRANPKCQVACGRTRYYAIDSEPENRPWKRTGEKIDTMFPAFLHSRWWGTSTPLYRRNITDKAGPWTRLRNEEDWEYDCRIASYGVQLFYCEEFVSDQREHSGERLSRRGSLDRHKLADRAEAHSLILRHARRAGIDANVPEMQHFARELFLLSRQCGAAGLRTEAENLFSLARAASDRKQAKGLDFRLYGVVARALGWTTAGRLAAYLDRMRS